MHKLDHHTSRHKLDHHTSRHKSCKL